MDKIGCVQATTQILKKKKKKGKQQQQAKDEVDRVKQAEKKRRRLEKALATSAAIRCELEKKKQKKKMEEEQQRLDEEGAAVAESVALHVLIGEEEDWGRPSDVGLFMGYRHTTESALKWTDGIGLALRTGVHNIRKNVGSLAPCLHEDATQGTTDVSVAAQAVSSLQIADDYPRTVVFNTMFRNEATLYKDF